MFGVIMPLCNRMFCCIFGWYFYIEFRLKCEKNIPALELFHCLPLWKTVLFVSSRAFSLSTPVENSEATWKKATKCNKLIPSKYNWKITYFGGAFWFLTIGIWTNTPVLAPVNMLKCWRICFKNIQALMKANFKENDQRIKSVPRLL